MSLRRASNRRFSNANACSCAVRTLSSKVFEFGGDEAFGVFQGLAALVVGRRLFGLNFGKLDVEAVNAVELDFEGREAGAFAFARFELEQEFVAVVLDVAQLVKFCAIALVDDAAVFEPDGGFGHHGGFEGFGAGRVSGKTA